MKRIWNTKFARLVDDLSIRKYGVSQSTLMRAAGQRLASVIRMHLTERDKVIYLVGKGNNGGDALLSINHLNIEPQRVMVFSFFGSGHLSPGCEEALRSLRENHPAIAIQPYSPAAFEPYVKTRTVVVDAIFGIGYRPPLQEPLVAQAFTELRLMPKAVIIAVDVPSGIDADSFELPSENLRAHDTISFGGLKPAQVVSPARDLSNRTEAVDIGFAPAAVEEANVQDPGKLFLIEAADIPPYPWHTLPKSAHKFDRGHTLVIGGSQGKLGAPVLSAIAALRAGCGWSSVAIPTELETHFPPLPLELTFERFFSGHKVDASALLKFAKERHVSAIVIGPGTTVQPIDEPCLDALIALSHEGINIIIDAGATQGILDKLKANDRKPNQNRFLLTPHPGEWNRLPLEQPKSYDDLTPVMQVTAMLGVTLIYKGATPLVFTSDRVIVHNENSNALAKAGTGDVFAGLCAGYAKCFASVEGCANQSFMTLARAVDTLTQRRDAHSLLPTDILDAIGSIC